MIQPTVLFIRSGAGGGSPQRGHVVLIDKATGESWLGVPQLVIEPQLIAIMFNSHLAQRERPAG
jgi:hypothetical protein